MNAWFLPRSIFDFENKVKKLKELNTEINKKDFWDNTQRAQKISIEASSIEKLINTLRSLETELQEFDELVNLVDDEELDLDEYLKEIIRFEEQIEEIEDEALYFGEYDDLSAVISINAGAGGVDAHDWAEMLMRMYLMWGEKNNYLVKTLDLQKADPVGIKSVTLEFEGDFSFGNLKGENGVHRLVRISPYDSNAKRHTTFASVFVYPLADESININIDSSEISWDTFRAGGAGGQGVNKVETAVRLKHKSSGIIIENSETRSQLENKEKALKLLKSQLYELELRKQEEEKQKIEGEKKKIEWGSQIRSYILHPYKMVKDLRTNHESSNPENVLNGELNDFIKTYLMKFGQRW